MKLRGMSIDLDLEMKGMYPDMLGMLLGMLLPVNLSL